MTKAEYEKAMYQTAIDCRDKKITSRQALEIRRALYKTYKGDKKCRKNE